jgi:hypothetical protein
MERKHGSACDFRLVSTYVPFLATIARAQGFLVAAFAVAPLVPTHVYTALLLLAAYFDALVHEGTSSSSLGGHLWPVCFVVLTRLAGPPGAKPAHDALLAVNVLWCAAVHALVASYTFRRRVPVGVAAILAANSACALCCLWLTSTQVSVLETPVRSVAFYVFVYVHFHVFQTRAQWDVATHACLGPHVGMHLLLVDGWCALASVCCLAFLCVRVYLQNQDHHDTELGAPQGASVEPIIEAEDMAELLQELLAAKAVALES